ncbi:MAG: hypothetical protein GY754_35175 [bacterium]|nr:hypothetical protein [bacterium]
MIANIVTFALTFTSSLLLLILFRRLDKSKLTMTKLNKFSSRRFNEFKSMAEAEKRKFNDATIEMDILIKKANSLSTNMANALREIENRLQGLDVEKSNLEKVEKDIKIISHAAQDVNKQIQFIGAAKEEFTSITQRITFLNENIVNIKNESSGIMDNFAARLRDRSQELSEDFSNSYTDSMVQMEKQLTERGEIILDNISLKIDAVAKTIEGAGNLNYQLDNLRSTLGDMENTVFADIKDKTAELNGNIEDAFENVDVEVDKVYDKMRHVEANVNDSKEKLIKTFEDQVDKIRTELDNLSIHAIAKKDEIVQATRKEAEDIRQRMENFEEKYLELETRLEETAQDKLEHLDSEFQSIELRFNNLSEKFDSDEEQIANFITGQSEKSKKDFSMMEQRLADIKAEILEYEEQNKIFSKSDHMVRKVENSIDNLKRILSDSQEEARDLEKFIKDTAQIKDIKKNVEREIRSYQGKKEKLTNIENEIKGLTELSDLMLTRSGSLQDNVNKVDIVESRLEMLSETYSTLESTIDELQEYEDLISKNVESVNKTTIQIKSLDGKINTYQKIIDRSDKRVEKMGKHLQDVEESTLILKSRESEIQGVKDKFDELDGLSALMEKRIDQIYAMFQKMDNLKNDIDNTDDRLQVMFNETDKKMKELAVFIKAVDNNNPILKQVNEDISPGKNINENMIKTVRELSNKGWSAADISNKLLIDENSIRFIINTTSL